MAVEVIKKKTYSKDDIKFYLKRKTQTSGRYRGSGGSVEVTNIGNIAADEDGNIYVLDTGDNDVKKYDKTGKYITAYALAAMTAPANIFISRGVAFISDIDSVGDDQVFIYSIQNFTLIYTIAENFQQVLDMQKDSYDNLLLPSYVGDTMYIRAHGTYRTEADTISQVPVGVGCDKEGYTYVADDDSANAANTRIRKFGLNGMEVTAGNWPISPGYNITGLCVDADEEYFYVTNTTNNRCEKYDLDGNHNRIVSVWHESNLLDVQVNDSYLFAFSSDGSISRIRVFDKTNYALVRLISTALDNATKIAVTNSANDLIFSNGETGGVTANQNIRVHKVSDGSTVTSFVTGKTGASGGICVIGDNLNTFVAIPDATNNTILKYKWDKTNKTFIRQHTFGADGTGNGQFKAPGAMTLSPYSDDVIICDTTNADVQFFTWGDNFTTSYFGSAGAGNGEFDGLRGVGVDGEGNIFTAEALEPDNNRAQKFDHEFNYVSQQAVDGGVRDIDVNSDDKVFIGVFGTAQILIHENGTSTTFGAYYSCFYAKSIIQSLDIYDGGIFTDENLDNLYFGSATAAYFYVYGVSSNFSETAELDWYDITRYVLLSDNLEFELTSDDSDFSLGAFSFGSVSVTLNNKNNTFNLESDTDSIFYDSLYRTCRNGSLIKITVSGADFFIGYIDGLAIQHTENTITFTLIDVLRKLELLALADIGAEDNDTVKTIIGKIIDNYFMEGYLTYDSDDIAVTYDAVVDDVSKLPNNAKDILIFLSKVGLFSFGTYNGNAFYTHSFINTLQNRTSDYMITDNNLLDKPEINSGEHRQFSSVVYGSQEFNFDGRVRWIYPEERKIDISGESITDTDVRQAIVDKYENITSFPTKELSNIIIPMFSLTDIKILEKQFVFNIIEF